MGLQPRCAAARGTRPGRNWSGTRRSRCIDRDHVGEHRWLEEAALARDADTGAEILTQHITHTAAGLTGCTHREPAKEA